jgi:uncharacterized protein DUF5989
MDTTEKSEYEKTAVQQSSRSVVGEFWYFLKQYRQWWLLPILIVLLLLGLVMVLSSTAAAPFIYTLF